MMKQTIFIFTITALLFAQTVNAQRGKGHNKERWERFRSEKVSFLTNNLDLSPEEAQQFWPLYNQMEKERSELQMKRRELENEVREAAYDMSDEEIIKLANEFVSTQEKEGALNRKYNDAFFKILPPKKVLLLYKAEGEFRMYMIKKYRDQHRKEGGKQP
jgi:Spy/CpxP family protein refolding chaperone